MMTQCAKVSFWAVLFALVAIPCYGWAASITETRAAIGKDCVAEAPFSTAMGHNTTASFEASTAMGDNTKASGYSSTAMGQNTIASGYYSTAMGQNTIASGNFSTAMGANTTAYSAYETVIGTFPTTYLPASTTVWNASDRLFVIGNGASEFNRSNAMVVLKNGNIGIGTASPGEDLEIYSNYPYVKFNGHRTSDARQIGVNNYGLVIYNNADSRYEMVIDNNGNIGIGETSPSKRLYVNGSAGGTQAWSASDEREKTDIKPIENALENIPEISGVSYRWKRGDEKESQGFDNKIHFGVIAQKVEAVYPELVDNPGITEKRKHVEYNGLVGVLIEAVKELKAQNEKQQAEIEELRMMIKDLKG